MNRIAMIQTPGDAVLSASKGFDFDHDGQRELVLVSVTFDPDPIEFYESVADDTFALVHVLELDDGVNDSYYPADAGDIDEDGLADLVVLAKDFMGAGVNDYGTRVYESVSAGSYPTPLAWDVVTSPGGWSFGGLIADTDGDGQQEIAVREPGAKLVVYENDGDDEYVQTYSETIPGQFGAQSFEILRDLDGDGKDVILSGGSNRIVAFESIGNDSYGVIWTWEFDPSINVQFMVDAGDLDGDGKKEFLAGGLQPNGPTALHVFEMVSNNEVEIVATLTQSNGAESYSSANVADVDGDGRKEIIFGTTWIVSVHENTGDNTWREVWSANSTIQDVGPLQSIGAGDHDGDGKDEIIIRSGGFIGGYTSIWEISPADAADMDGDDVVDVIDNCAVTSNPGQQDADSDTVGDLCDNCVYGPNMGQGAATFGQTIEALDPETYSWSEPAEVVVASGDLAVISTYKVDLVQTLPLGTSFMDPSVPATSQGFFYLIKPDCGVGSWQSDLGAEPGRDAALP